MLRSALAGLASSGASRILSTCRLMSAGAAAATLTSRASLEELLHRAPWLLLLQVPGAGRGLFAVGDIEQGMVVHEEAPMLWTPHPSSLATTCHSCLRPLPPNSGPKMPQPLSSSDSGMGTTSGRCPASSGDAPRLHFCSPGCRAEGEATWAAVAADADLRPLQQACREGGDKFPLIAAQLACMQVQLWAQQDQQKGQQRTAKGGDSSQHDVGSDSSAAGQAVAPPAAGAQWSDKLVARGDALTQLRHLCYANMQQPPEPWVRLHSLLLRGLQPLASSARWAAVCTPERLQREISLDWFCGVLARLHLNAFRVDTVPPLDLTADPSTLLRAAAASLGGSAAAAAVPGAGMPGGSGHSSDDMTGSPGQHLPGSAAFLLASLFNHSCEPNLVVSWPHNNAVARFTAARDIAAHEQLTISYIDAEQGAAQRRAALQFAYGFACRCPRCREGA